MDIKPHKNFYPFKKLNKNIINALVKDIAEGSTHKAASYANGITPRCFDMWRKQGETDLEAGQPDTLPAIFVLSLYKVKQIEIKECRQKIKNEPRGHFGAQWTLEHAYWRDFCSNVSAIELAKEIEDLRSELKGRSNNGEVECSEKEEDPKE